MTPSILLAWVGLVAGVSAACTRASLQEATAAYIKAQTAGQPNLLSLAANASYAENDVSLDITKGVLAQPITIDFSRSIYDTVECATFTELAAATGSHPYVIHTHLRFTDDKISTVQSVVTDAGDWLFNATTFLFYTQAEKWDSIPEAKRDTRAVIKAAADAYLNQWGNPTLPVPHGTPCTRLEAGLYTGQRDPTANTCPMGAFPQPLNVTNRRYVIDEEIGSVDVFNDFPWLEKSIVNGSTPSSNLFRVEGGLIRYIHEVTVCATSNCGR